jgi:hypothetical protein
MNAPLSAQLQRSDEEVHSEKSDSGDHGSVRLLSFLDNNRPSREQFDLSPGHVE